MSLATQRLCGKKTVEALRKIHAEDAKESIIIYMINTYSSH